MEEIFIFNIMDYFDDNNFINKISFLCNHSKIQKRRKFINHKRSCKLFNDTFNYKQYASEQLQDYLETDIDLNEILKDIIENLLNESLLERCHMNIYKNYILFPKYCSSSIIYNYKKNGKLDKNNIIFNHSSFIKTNIKLCSTYRLPRIQKNILINHYPLAKALIY